MSQPAPETPAAFVMVCHGYATGLPDSPAGQYLECYDVDAHGGRGAASWTIDPAQALTFVSAQAAWDCWRQQSTVAPTRADGQPNRPLTAFTISIEETTR